MKPITRAFALASALLLAPATFAAPAHDLYLHVEVEDGGGTDLDITLPLAAVGLVAALVPGGFDANVSVDGSDVDVRELARVWKELRRRPDMTYVTIRESNGGRVRIAKSKGHLLLSVVDHDERVEIKMPSRAVDALFASFSDDTTRLDVKAMLSAIASSRAGEILAISGKDRVRIWIDDEE